MPTIPIKATERSGLFFWKPRSTVASLSATDLQRRYLNVVFRYVTARIQGDTEAEDITADVFSAAFAAPQKQEVTLKQEEWQGAS